MHVYTVYMQTVNIKHFTYVMNQPYVLKWKLEIMNDSHFQYLLFQDLYINLLKMMQEKKLKQSFLTAPLRCFVSK